MLHLTAKVGVVNLQTMVTPVDVSYVVHHDAKSRTGSYWSFGIGLISSKLSKHKINTTSLTTAKLVGVADYLPQILSHYLFMKEQGFPIKNSMILQDNKLAILLEIGITLFI